MAASKSTSTNCIPHKLLTERLSDCSATDLSISPWGKIALSGRKGKNEFSFVHVYSGVGSDCTQDLKLVYSRAFEAGKYPFRYTSFLADESENIVTGSGFKAEVIDSRNQRTVVELVLEDVIQSVSTKDGKIFLFVYHPARVFIYNNQFQEMRVIKLKCVNESDSIWDTAVTNDKLHLCVDHRLIVYNYEIPKVLQEYKQSSKWGSTLDTDSVAVDEELGLTIAAWNDDLIIVYTMGETEPFACFKETRVASKIRIFGKGGSMLVTGPGCTLKVFKLTDLFSFDAVKERLVALLRKDELVKLAKILGVSMPNAFALLKLKSSTRAFLTKCEEKEYLKPSDVTSFEDALTKVNPSHCVVLKTYQKIHRGNYEGGPTCNDLKHDTEKWSACEEKVGLEPGEKGESDDNFEQTKSEEPQDKLRRCFTFLKKNISKDWKDLGRCLKQIMENDLNRLEMEHAGNIKETIYQMLLLWQERTGGAATHQVLIDALIEIDKRNLAEQLEAL